MKSDEYEWDDAKAGDNVRKHSIRFEQAVEACEDQFAVVDFDDSEDYDEDRYVLIGHTSIDLLMVVYTERNERRRIISARKSNSYERRKYRRAMEEE